jgi:3-phosphoshikimate 1-carboxyvinyltransferase
MDCIVQKSSLHGEITVPGSKSHTIRAVLLAALADGVSVIRNPLNHGDGKSALNSARAFGAEITEKAGVWTVKGAGKAKLPDNVIDCGNSGTTTNFTIALASLCEGYTLITGDEQIRRRPVAPLVSAINELGCNAFLCRPGTDAPPVVVGGKIRGGEAHLSGFNSQFVSALLLAAAIADGDTVIYVETPLEKPYLQMTLDWMRRYGVLAECSGDYTRFAVHGGQSYHATDSVIPGDWSAAAFPLVAAVCTPSVLMINGVDFDDVQGDKVIVDHLLAMGADIVKERTRNRLIVRGGKKLSGGATINLNDTPDMLPSLAVAAAYAEGTTTFTGLAHVRVKETDRVAVMEKELNKLGVQVQTGADTMTIYGGEPLTGAAVESYGDHRVAMALAVAGLFAEGGVRVRVVECIPVSFPGFFELLEGVGAKCDLV